MRERIPLEILRLEGSPNVKRSLAREAAEQNAPPLDESTKSEVEKLDELIAKTMKAAHRGSTFNGKPNPAFDHLAKLIKSRAVLLGAKARGKTVSDTIATVDAFFKKAGVS